MEGRYVTCPHCGDNMAIQAEWTDLGASPQGEINQWERWRCEECERVFTIEAHYAMTSYRVIKGNKDEGCYRDEDLGEEQEVDYRTKPGRKPLLLRVWFLFGDPEFYFFILILHGILLIYSYANILYALRQGVQEVIRW